MKNKVVKNTFFVILNYILFTFIVNIRFFISNLLNRGGNYQLDLINVTAVISVIFISLIYIFRKSIFQKKVFFWIIYCSLLLYSLAQAYYVNFIVYPFIFIYIYLMLITYFTILVYKRCFEISIVTSFSTLILGTFVLGMFGLLIIVKYVMLLSTILIGVYIYKVYKNNKKDLIKARDVLFSDGFIIYTIIFTIAILGGAGMYVNSWDEYSHWAYDAKAVIYYSKFGNAQEIMSKTKAYAPIFSAWHYIVAIFNGFSEHNLFIGLNIFIATYLMPAFTLLKDKKLFIKILSVIAIYFCCYIFGGVYIYSSLYADLAISIIFSATLILYFCIPDKENTNLLTIIMMLVILTLSKTNGFAAGITFLSMVLINEVLNKETKGNDLKKYIVNIIKKYYKYLLAIIITFLIWKIYNVFMGKITHEYYNAVILPDSLRGDLALKLNSEFIRNFAKSVIKSFDSTLIHSVISISMYQYLIIIFSLLFAVYYIESKKANIALNKMFVFILGYFVFYTLTVVAMFYAMSLYEASNLASFGRYLNWFHVGALVYILAYIQKLDLNKRHMPLIVIYVVIIFMIGFNNLTYFVYKDLNSGSYSTYLTYTQKVNIIKKNVPKESMVYIIDQEDKEGIMAMWHVRYYAFPIQTNASSGAISWKIKTKKNKDDLQNWGLTKTKWVKQLTKYKFEYVYLFSSDNEFFEKTKDLYSDYELAKKSTLFKVKVKNEKVILIPIK